MSDKTKIQWCDSTVNFWTGCSKVSEGCKNCFAERLAKRYGWGEWGEGNPRHRFANAAKNLARLNRKPWVCDGCGCSHYTRQEAQNCGCWNCPGTHRRRVFINDLSDWLDPDVPVEWLAEMLDAIRLATDVEIILCTKRLFTNKPEVFFSRILSAHKHVIDHRGVCELSEWLFCWADRINIPSHITILTSIENQQTAEERIPQLLKIPAARRGLSIEPMLGPVDLTKLCADESLGVTYNALTGHGSWNDDKQAEPLSWVIVGGESGPNARPCNIEWIRSIIQQCKAAGVPCFVKQLGSNPVCADGLPPFRDGLYEFKQNYGNPQEWPEDLRVREFVK